MTELTRRHLLLGGSAVGVAAVGGFALAGAVSPGDVLGWFSDEPAPSGPVAHSFVSRPDLRPPMVTVTTPALGADPGHMFLTPAPGYMEPPPSGAQAGPLIIDNAGQPVWFAPAREVRYNDFTNVTTDLKVQTFRGQRVLTWWRGDVFVPPGFGHGEHVIADRSYREIATVRAGHGMQSDLHELVITPRDTALIIAYRPVQHQGRAVLEGVVQELDIDTGRVLFEWPSLQHVPTAESLQPPPGDPAQPYDYIHLNSVALDADNTLLVSARNTQAVYKIARGTGRVVWRLGGNNSDFTLGAGATFVMQHDARPLPGGTIGIFDNGAPQPTGAGSRAIVLRLDEAAHTGELVREHTSPNGLHAVNQGNAQFLPSGHAFVSWGNQAWISEFGRAGNLLFNATYGPGLDTYRAFRFEWDATPPEAPVAAARQQPDGGMTVYASWNGATRVARWRVLAGPRTEELRVVHEADRTGFETAVAVSRQAYTAVHALDREGAVLGRSAAAEVAET